MSDVGEYEKPVILLPWANELNNYVYLVTRCVTCGHGMRVKVRHLTTHTCMWVFWGGKQYLTDDDMWSTLNERAPYKRGCPGLTVLYYDTLRLPCTHMLPPHCQSIAVPKSNSDSLEIIQGVPYTTYKFYEISTY